MRDDVGTIYDCSETMIGMRLPISRILTGPEGRRPLPDKHLRRGMPLAPMKGASMMRPLKGKKQVNRDFIRITLDKSNDIGTFLVERFSLLETFEYGREARFANIVKDEGYYYDALVMKEGKMLKRDNLWTFQEGSLSCTAHIKVVRKTITAFTFNSQEESDTLPDLAESCQRLRPEYEPSIKPFRSFAEVIKERAKSCPDMVYRAPETFDWTDKCAIIYHILRGEKALGRTGFMGLTRLAQEMADRFSVTGLFVTSAELFGMLQEMKGVKLVEHGALGPDQTIPDHTELWRAV